MVNHQKDWYCLIKMATLEDGEKKEKDKHYNKIKEAEEQRIYAPEGPWYTLGRAIKKTFGNSTWSDEVVGEFERTVAAWIKALNVDGVCDCLSEEWDSYLIGIRGKACCYWVKRVGGEGVENDVRRERRNGRG